MDAILGTAKAPQPHMETATLSLRVTDKPRDLPKAQGVFAISYTAGEAPLRSLTD